MSSTGLSVDAIERGLRERGVPADKARREALRIACVVLDEVEELDRTDTRLEKQIVAETDKHLRAMGFTVWNLSQPRATKLTAGIPDRLYTCPARGLAVFWEAKTPSGQQRPDQRVFQEHADATGLHYVLGTDAVLFRWLAARGIALTHAPT